MKILMLVNWKVKRCASIPKDTQSPDYVINNQPYWFFRYFPEGTQVDVVDCRSNRFLEHFEKERLRFYVFQTLRVLPRLNQYDIVISHGMQSGIVLCLWRRLFGNGKYKHIVFDIGAFNSARESGHALKVMQFASHSLDGVIYHTPSQIKYYEKCFPWLVEKSKYITFGTDDIFFRNKADAMQSKLSILDKENHYVLCIGYHQRDWKTLLKAYSHVDTSLKLRMIGNKDIAINDERIELVGRVSIDELIRQILQAEFCVLPLEDHNYSFGQMTLLQQMILSKAVIVADVPSIRPYIISEKNGLFNLLTYQAGNDDMLAKQITRLIDDSVLRDSIGTEAKKTVIESFNEKIMADKISDYLISLI